MVTGQDTIPRYFRRADVSALACTLTGWRARRCAAAGRRSPRETLLRKTRRGDFRIRRELLKAIPTITGAIDAGRRITRQNLQKRPSGASRSGTRKPPPETEPKKISVARLPVTGSDVFGREEDIAFLDARLGKPAGKCRYNRCLGRSREIDAGQPLAPTDGYRTLSFCRASFWLVLL